MTIQALLSLLHLSGPGLPIGAFAYSQGLETAVERGLISDAVTLTDWLTPILLRGQAHLEIPLLYRIYAAWLAEDLPTLEHWQAILLANRESAELVDEEQKLGQTLYRLLTSLGLALPEQAKVFSYLPLFTKAACHYKIPLEQTAAGWLWSWLENQVTAACKTMPLGQTAAQQVLITMMPRIEQAITTGATVADTDVGLTLPHFAMMSSWHETQYSRLFRS
jgi:urease accessory protein